MRCFAGRGPEGSTSLEKGSEEAVGKAGLRGIFLPILIFLMNLYLSANGAAEYTNKAMVVEMIMVHRAGISLDLAVGGRRMA